MTSHLKRHHPGPLVEEFKQHLKKPRHDFVLEHPEQRSVTRVSETMQSVQSQFDDLLVTCVLATMIPLHVVEQKSFLDLMRFRLGTSMKLSIMSRRTLGRRISEYHEKAPSSLRSALKETQWVATTADIWSCPSRSFLGMTVHWIDKDCVRESAALACKRFEDAHTFDRVTAVIDEIDSSFDLKGKVTATITDNGSNFVKAFAEFGVDTGSMVLTEDEDMEEPEEGDFLISFM